MTQVGATAVVSEKECSLQIVDHSDLPRAFPCKETCLLDNFTVAYFLTQNVLTHFGRKIDDDCMMEVVQNTHVAARFQRIAIGENVFLIDGAHTPRSMLAASTWFRGEMKSLRENTKRTLLFYCGRDKNSVSLLASLVTLPFDRIVLTMVKHPKPEYTWDVGGEVHSRHVELPTVEEVMAKEGIADSHLFDSIPSCSVEWLVYLARIWRIEEFLQKESPK